jgi:hypothetical protein
MNIFHLKKTILSKGEILLLLITIKREREIELISTIVTNMNYQEN